MKSIQKQPYSVRRHTWANNKSTESEVATLSGILQQADPEFATQHNLTISKAYVLYIPDTEADIKDGDTLVSPVERFYRVKGVNIYPYGVNAHIKAILELTGDIAE